MQNYLQSELLKLEMFPRLGRVVPEIDREDIREIILGKYRIIYHIIAEEVEIITIHHGARPLEYVNMPSFM